MTNENDLLTAYGNEVINSLPVPEIKAAITCLIQLSDVLISSDYKSHVIVEDVIELLFRSQGHVFELIG